MCLRLRDAGLLFKHVPSGYFRMAPPILRRAKAKPIDSASLQQRMGVAFTDVNTHTCSLRLRLRMLTVIHDSNAIRQRITKHCTELTVGARSLAQQSEKINADGS